MADRQIASEEVGWTFACSVADIGPSGRHRLTVDGRDIVIVRVRDNIYALDSFCYHAGGPLYNGDIEELGGRLCMVCPWHRYKVCLDTGDNYYESVDPHNLAKPPVWKTGGIRQRTHAVRTVKGKVFVKLSSQKEVLDSDRYNNRRDDG